MRQFKMALAALTLMTVAVFTAGCSPEKMDVSGTIDGHDYVDLGLPSGTKWATCNVGANRPQDYGDYFAWGETQSKSVYNWENYQFCNTDNGRVLTKYNGSDHLTELQVEDDAAKVNWGNDWCIPTYEQWEELINNCTVTWTKKNGTRGCLVKGLNGNSIFLPAAKARWQDGYTDYAVWVGEYGSYWTKKLYTGYSWEAWTLFLDFEDFKMEEEYRGDGRSIRPVVR